MHENIEYKYYSIGERIYRNDELPFNVNFIIKGEKDTCPINRELINNNRKEGGTFMAG